MRFHCARQAEFKAGRYVNAIQLYTRSVERSLSRPPWENTAFTRDEVSSALLNRSAAAGSLGDWLVYFERRLIATTDTNMLPSQGVRLRRCRSVHQAQREKCKGLLPVSCSYSSLGLSPANIC